jgi:hypothetical protein
LTLKLSERPPFTACQPQVEFPFLVPLAAAHDRQIVAPRQFSQQCCEFLVVAVGLDELHHPPEISGREPPRVRLPLPDVIGELRDGPLSPAIGRDPSADVLADLPVEVDQCLVDGGDGPRPGGVDQPQDFVKFRLGGNVGRRSDERPLLALLGFLAQGCLPSISATACGTFAPVGALGVVAVNVIRASNVL